MNGLLIASPEYKRLPFPPLLKNTISKPGWSRIRQDGDGNRFCKPFSGKVAGPLCPSSGIAISQGIKGGLITCGAVFDELPRFEDQLRLNAPWPGAR